MRENEKGMIEVGYNDWLGGFMSDKRLTAIVSTLLSKQVVDKKTITTLIDHGYIDYYVFATNTELHKQKLTEELNELQISSNTIEKIRTVYLNTKVGGRKTRVRKIQKKRRTFRNKKN